MKERPTTWQKTPSLLPHAMTRQPGQDYRRPSSWRISLLCTKKEAELSSLPTTQEKENAQSSVNFLVAGLSPSHTKGQTRISVQLIGKQRGAPGAQRISGRLELWLSRGSLDSAKWPLPGMSHSAAQPAFIPTADLWNPAEDFWVRSFFMIVAFFCQRRFLSYFLQRIRVIISSIFLDSSKNEKHLGHCLH